MKIIVEVKRLDHFCLPGLDDSSSLAVLVHLNNSESKEKTGFKPNGSEFTWNERFEFDAHGKDSNVVTFEIISSENDNILASSELSCANKGKLVLDMNSGGSVIGKLHVSTKIAKINRGPQYLLKINANSAKDLSAANPDEKNQFYLVLQIHGNQPYKTGLVANSVNPVWDEDFEIPITDPEQSILNVSAFQVGSGGGEETKIGQFDIRMMDCGFHQNDDFFRLNKMVDGIQTTNGQVRLVFSIDELERGSPSNSSNGENDASYDSKNLSLSDSSSTIADEAVLPDKNAEVILSSSDNESIKGEETNKENAEVILSSSDDSSSIKQEKIELHKEGSEKEKLNSNPILSTFNNSRSTKQEEIELQIEGANKENTEPILSSDDDSHSTKQEKTEIKKGESDKESDSGNGDNYDQIHEDEIKLKNENAKEDSFPSSNKNPILDVDSEKTTSVSYSYVDSYYSEELNENQNSHHLPQTETKIEKLFIEEEEAFETYNKQDSPPPFLSSKDNKIQMQKNVNEKEMSSSSSNDNDAEIPQIIISREFIEEESINSTSDNEIETQKEKEILVVNDDDETTSVSYSYLDSYYSEGSSEEMNILDEELASDEDNMQEMHHDDEHLTISKSSEQTANTNNAPIIEEPDSIYQQPAKQMMLKMTVLTATKLRRPKNTSINPYILMKLRGSNTENHTKYIDHSTEPSWSETFEIDINDMKKDVLEITAMSHDNVEDFVIGVAEIELKRINTDERMDELLALHKSLDDETEQGKIHIKYFVSEKMEPIPQDDDEEQLKLVQPQKKMVVVHVPKTIRRKLKAWRVRKYQEMKHVTKSRINQKTGIKEHYVEEIPVQKEERYEEEEDIEFEESCEEEMYESEAIRRNLLTQKEDSSEDNHKEKPPPIEVIRFTKKINFDSSSSSSSSEEKKKGTKAPTKNKKGRKSQWLEEEEEPKETKRKENQNESTRASLFDDDDEDDMEGSQTSSRTKDVAEHKFLHVLVEETDEVPDNDEDIFVHTKVKPKSPKNKSLIDPAILKLFIKDSNASLSFKASQVKTPVKQQEHPNAKANQDKTPVKQQKVTNIKTKQTAKPSSKLVPPNDRRRKGAQWFDEEEEKSDKPRKSLQSKFLDSSSDEDGIFQKSKKNPIRIDEGLPDNHNRAPMKRVKKEVSATLIPPSSPNRVSDALKDKLGESKSRQSNKQRVAEQKKHKEFHATKVSFADDPKERNVKKIPKRDD